MSVVQNILVTSEDFYHQVGVLENYLNCFGVTVTRYNPEQEFIGRCDYDKRLLSLNTWDVKQALITLLHEGGHWMSYVRSQDKNFDEEFNRGHREKLAYLYGWALCKRHNFDVSAEEWKKFHDHYGWDNLDNEVKGC